MSKYLITFLVFFLVSCGSMPKHVDIRSDEQPTISFNTSAIGSEVFVNDQFLGVISKKKTIFPVTTGTHEIKIKTPSGRVIQRTIFIQGNSRKEINLNQ